MNQQQRAVVQQALEALELNNQEWKELADSGDCGFWKAEDQDHYKQASASITALRQMLEHPEQGEVVVKSNGHVSPLLTHMMNRRTKAEAQPVQEPVSFDDWPEYHEHAMGCGLEDRGITDRYEAMRYGWDEALERAWEAVNLLGPLYTTPPAQPADEPDRLLLAAMDLARQQHSRIEELEALLAKAQPAPEQEPDSECNPHDLCAGCRCKFSKEYEPPASAMQKAFNAAIDFAIEEGIGAAVFLRAWREGDTSEWPEFDATPTQGETK